jgi:hypothetical protein
MGISQRSCRNTGRGAGRSDGHPALMSSYRAELGGILASLYLIFRVCNYYQLQSNQATLFCDNKGALTKAFTPLSSITPYFRTDQDILTLTQQLLQMIPITIIGKWVKIGALNMILTTTWIN